LDSTVIYIILGYVALILIAYVIQEKFIFKPEKLPADFKFEYDASFEELNFYPAENVKINGLHFKREKPNGLIFYLHGNTRSIKGWAKYAKDFYRYNYDVLLVDYRGFGKSTGKRSERELKADLQFIYNELAKKYTEHHLIMYGRSIGSGFATKLASENSPRYLILDSPYYSFLKVAERFLPFLPHRWYLRYHLRTDKWIRKVNCHTYIIHGTKDWLIPYKQSVALKNINPDKITLITIEGGGHNNLPKFNEYHNFIRDILQY